MSSFFFAVNSNTTGTAPTVSAVSTALTIAGACKVGDGVQTYGKYTTTWSMANVDDVTYQNKIYENSVYVATKLNSVVTYAVTAPGVQTDSRHVTAVDKTYRIDVIRISDSAVVSSATGNDYIDTFGDCTGPF